MKKIIRLTEQDLHNLIRESINNIIGEGNDFEPGKYKGKWAVYDKGSRTYSDIGIGKKKATAKAKELNDYCAKKDKDENVNEARKEKDPMKQWFKDMEDIQKHRDNMEYITKGGRKPKHWKNNEEQ